MKHLLEQELIDALSVIQSSLEGITDSYYDDNDSDFSCVRCSGSAGRYVYEKQEAILSMGEDK
jgi:hypothetical protein